jgi:hypothetical protein
MAEPSGATQAVRPRGERFFRNVLWSWTGVAASFFTGFVITPIVIRKLGPEHYGIWLQVFSIQRSHTLHCRERPTADTGSIPRSRSAFGIRTFSY